MNRTEKHRMTRMKNDMAFQQRTRTLNFSDYKNMYPPSLHILSKMPAGATPVQACDEVGKWLDEHPEEWNKPSYHLLIKALKAAY